MASNTANPSGGNPRGGSGKSPLAPPSGGAARQGWGGALAAHREAFLWGGLGVVLALLLVHAISHFNLMAIVVLTTIPLAVVVALNVEFGIYCFLTYACVLAFLIRMLPPSHSGPLGMALDALLGLMTLRMLLDLNRRKDWGLLRTPMTVPILTFFVFECIEVFNPAAPSILFGLYGLRPTARILAFFLMLYYFRKRAAIKRFIWVWMVLSFLMGCYGIFQHVHGLLWQEMQWLLTEGNAKTHILHGYVRVFSTVSDAATFGFLMIMASLMLFALAITARGWTQILLLVSTLPMLYGMVVSFSRGPIVSLAAGAAIMVLASRNWKLGIGVSAVAGLGLVLLMASGSTQLVDRMSTATDPMQDASFMVRVGYIEQYLPNILAHPFGYGIDASGGGAYAALGDEAADSSNTVAGVPTDNYYFKTALELGWVGLILFSWVNLAAMWQMYVVYRRARDPYYKALALGLFACFFAIFVGAFSNNINCQKPIDQLFWMIIGLSMLIGQAQTSPARQVLMLPSPPEGGRGILDRRPGGTIG